MEETRYAITENVLMDIVNYAVKHPDKHFCMDAYVDSDPFLSCFFLKDDEDADYIWELDEVAKTKQEVIDEM